MSKVVIQRAEKDVYELVIGGTVITQYEQTIMNHPSDWRQDALDNGASETDVKHFEYIDSKQE